MSEECWKVTSYFGERDRVEGRLFSDVLLDRFGEYGVRTSVLLRATGGFGLQHHLRSDETLTMSEDPSVVAVAVDSRARIERLLPAIARLQRTGLLTVERARELGDPGATQLAPELAEAAQLTVYVGRHERVSRRPAHVAVCALLKEHGVAGASVLMGVDGTIHKARERAEFWSRNVFVPTMVLAVGPGDRIQAVLPRLEELLERPTITVERVRVCKRDGELLAAPHDLPAADDRGVAMWQKLMVYTSESRTYDGEPIHRGIIRRLRGGNSTGATALRGVWGFHGEHEPHGDRFFQLGRRVPVVTVVVDTPDRIAEAFGTIDELTSEHGLVTSEMVPALTRFSPHGRTGDLRLASYDF